MEILERIQLDAQRSMAVYGEPNLFEAELCQALAARSLGPLGDRYRADAEEIERALAGMGHTLPGPVHVAEYPHNSFNAQACRVRNGTLLLVNTGLSILLYEVARAFGAQVVFASLTTDGRIDLQEQTPAMRERAGNAWATLASALARYVLRADFSLDSKQESDVTTRGFMSFVIYRSAMLFAVAHEYGHFLAGHLDRHPGLPTSTEWLRKSRDQEFEADQIAALLSLRVHAQMGELSPTRAANLAVVGPFLFLSVDHMLSRVRDEVCHRARDLIVSDHPPSDIRGAALRALLEDVAGPDSLQMADSTIQALAPQEDQVVEQVRRLMTDQPER